LDTLDPLILAKVLNQEFDSGNMNDSELRNAISDFMTLADKEALSESNDLQPYEKLATFINNLTPDLRRQFIDSSFSSSNRESLKATEQILTNLSSSTILDTLQDISLNRLSVSPIVFALLQRLGENSASTEKDPEFSSEEENMSQKMKTIFREYASEEFVPDDYQKKLNYIITNDQIPRLNMEEVTELLNTIENHAVENSISQILLNLVRQGVETPEERDLLLQSLTDMFGFFLQTGEYGQLQKMLDQLEDDTFPLEIKRRLTIEYGRSDYLEEILNGLSIWGKPRYGDIRTLIYKIGGPFVEPILDRLSEEDNMSLRRFYMDCLIEMGGITEAAIIKRLHDPRWYFVRNLLNIISAQGGYSAIQSIRPLLQNKDPRLRHEALKTLVYLRDPEAEEQIIDNLQSENLDLQNAAIILAEQCKAPAVAAKLTEMLSQGGYSQSECERKSSIVQTLGEIGRAEVLPELAKILGSRSIFHSQHLTKLKKDIIRTLPKYPHRVSGPILERIADGYGELSRLAKETAGIIRYEK
ncbi:MAG: HEAT repeat domain-containing protein, partial [Desulfuromonadaceae bacterium]|nr:HEAT repeat domain-containing protein [Desulfuromonadaceae bacterium]